jgi:putative phosphoesterase
MFRIGVISDTHNYLDPQVLTLFEGVDHILHGGDIGMPWLILELQAIAPVTAVLGNTDEAGLRFSETEAVELDGRKFLVHHIVNPHALEDGIKSRIAREKPDVVVFGHTHKPFNQVIGQTLYLNPGYAGKSRFGMERSVAILHCDKKEIRPEFLKL